MKTAIVTMAIGDAYLTRWRRFSEGGWRAYCERHGYDLVVVDQPLDRSPRAASRSPAWQKCLVLDPEISRDYERVVWVDADIVINPQSPQICADVPIDRIGAVDEHAFPTRELRFRVVDWLEASWQTRDARIAREWALFKSPPDWHARFGLPRRGAHIVQTGVLVLSPRHHRELLEHVYRSYDDVEGERLNYEMRPLSFEIQERQLAFWLDPRFNALAGFLAVCREVVEKRRFITPGDTKSFLSDLYRTNYFLHFAGRRDLEDQLAELDL